MAEGLCGAEVNANNRTPDVVGYLHYSNTYTHIWLIILEAESGTFYKMNSILSSRRYLDETSPIDKKGQMQ